jgi:uncharacterized protein YjiS (DUF1127 family)
MFSHFVELQNRYRYFTVSAAQVHACHINLEEALKEYERSRLALEELQKELATDIEHIIEAVAPAPPQSSALIARAIRIKDEIDEVVK